LKKTRNENEFRSRNELNLRTIAHLRTENDAKEAAFSHQKLESREWKDALEAKILENKRLKAFCEEKDQENERICDEKSQLELAFNKLSQEKKLAFNEKETMAASLKEKEWKLKELEKNYEKINFERKELFEKTKKVFIFIMLFGMIFLFIICFSSTFLSLSCFFQYFKGILKNFFSILSSFIVF